MIYENDINRAFDYVVECGDGLYSCWEGIGAQRVYIQNGEESIKTVVPTSQTGLETIGISSGKKNYFYVRWQNLKHINFQASAKPICSCGTGEIVLNLRLVSVTKCIDIFALAITIKKCLENFCIKKKSRIKDIIFDEAVIDRPSVYEEETGRMYKGIEEDLLAINFMVVLSECKGVKLSDCKPTTLPTTK